MMELILRKCGSEHAETVGEIVDFKTDKIVKRITKSKAYSLGTESTLNYITLNDTILVSNYSSEGSVELWIRLNGDLFYGRGEIKALDQERRLLIVETPIPLFNKDGAEVVQLIKKSK